MNLTIRRATPSDAAALMAFGTRMFVETFGPDNRPEDLAAHLAATFGPEQQARELADPTYATLVMEASASLAAYAQLRVSAPPPCVTGPSPVEILRFYVDRPWHGQGTAQQLMAAAFDAARALGGQTLWLSVWERNPRAIAFYSKCGFRDVGGAVFLLGQDRQFDRVVVADLGRHP